MESRIGHAAILLFASALAVGGCASGKKGGTAVLVVTDGGQVRGCSFMGRVNQTATENEGASEGMLRQRVADMGGNTLLLRAAGSGEAWSCPERPGVHISSATHPTPTPVGRLLTPVGRLPTPVVVTTPRT